MNFWRAIGGLVLLAIVAFTVVRFESFLKEHHIAKNLHLEHQSLHAQAAIEKQCELMFPRAGQMKLRCVEGDL